MKFVSLLIAFCFSLNVLASTGTVQELEKAFNDFQYAITVEWDQKDPAFKEAQTKAFYEKVSLLMSEGLSKDDVEKFIESKVADPQVLSAMKLKLALSANVGSVEELAKLLSTHSVDLYSQGASWSGDAALWIGGGLLLAIVGYLVWFEATHECVAWGEEYRCYTTGAGYGYVTTCNWYNICIEYAKK